MNDPTIPSRFEAMLPRETLYRRIRESITTTTATATSFRVRVAAALAASSLLAIAVVALAAQQTYGGHAMGLSGGAAATSRLLLVSCLLVASSTLVLRRGPSSLGTRAPALWLTASLAVPLYAALTLFHPVHAAAPLPAAVLISPWGLRCLLIAALVGTSVLLSFTLALRHAVPTAPAARSGALGATAGTWAGLAVFIFCPSADTTHLLLGHVLPVLAFTAIGCLALPRVLRV